MQRSSCNSGDPGSIPELERFTEEGIGYLFQYSWASHVAQLIKNPPTIQETWVQCLGWDDPLEKGMATLSWLPSPGLENSMDCIVCGIIKSWTRLSDFHFHGLYFVYFLSNLYYNNYFLLLLLVFFF